MLVTEMQWIFCKKKNEFRNITQFTARIRSHKRCMRQRKYGACSEQMLPPQKWLGRSINSETCTVEWKVEQRQRLGQNTADTSQLPLI
jgi:hypothetical protein